VLWVEVFAVFGVCHLAGDFILQTEWQATRKFGGLGSDGSARRALLAHTATYTLAFVPAFVWLWPEDGAWVLLLAALLFATHAAIDDGRGAHWYSRRVKRTDPARNPVVVAAVDQTFHIVVLFGLALLAVA
jgi:hypothetical protein